MINKFMFYIYTLYIYRLRDDIVRVLKEKDKHTFNYVVNSLRNTIAHS